MKNFNFKRIILSVLVLLVSNSQASWVDYAQSLWHRACSNFSSNQKVAIGIGLIGSLAAICFYRCKTYQEHASQKILFVRKSPQLTYAAAAFKENVEYKTMQDRCYMSESENYRFYAVFDGHGDGGHIIAQYLVDNLCKNIVSNSKFDQDPKQAILNGCKKTNEDLQQKGYGYRSGSTATFALIKGNKVYVGNVGDSRTVLSSNDIAIPLSVDQDASRADEFLRVQNLGGKFDQHKRLFSKYSSLAMTRAFGDFEFGDHLICTPEIQEHDITPNDQFLILASDGIWDHLTALNGGNEQRGNQAGVNMVLNELNQPDASLQTAANKLADMMYQADTRKDDRMVVLVNLKKEGF